MQKSEYRQYPQYRTPKYVGVQAVSAVQSQNTASTRRILSRNTTGTVGTPVSPTERNFLQLSLVAPSVNVFCKTMGLNLSSRCTDGPSILLTSEYAEHIESIWYIWYCEYSLAARARPTDKILPVLAVPAAQNPQILKKSTGCIHSNEPRNPASPELPAVQNLYSQYPQCINPKYCERTNSLLYFF